MKLFNSLTRKTEEISLRTEKIGVYTCGPTVYDRVSIGNWRTYALGDFLVRSLAYLGYPVDYVMNITDVGHLTGDNLGDADTGEDRMEKAVKRERKTAWEVAGQYTADFLAGFDKLNFVRPRVFCKATEHIQEQIELISRLEARGFTYKITDGIYFDTRAYEAAGNKYGELSTLSDRKAGVRVEPNQEKKDPRDFGLWKFSPKDKKRDMEWDSPWGKGFPGWHVECSAMSMKYLGEQFDIHLGGEDLQSTHHPNEIAQSEAATGKKPFVRWWLHQAFLLVDGGRMGKSLGNAYTLDDLERRGFSPLSLKYFFLTGHYRRQLNFTFKALEGAQSAFLKLGALVGNYRESRERTDLAEDKLAKIDQFRNAFRQAVENDLDLPKALSLVWAVVKSNISDYDKSDLILDFDQVFGLKLNQVREKPEKLPAAVARLLKQREELRRKKEFEKADKIREEIRKLGYRVEDKAD